MPFNTEKRLTINDFLKAVQERLQENPEALSFFEIFLMADFVQDLIREAELNSELIKLPLLPGDYDLIYLFAAGKLRGAASRNFSRVQLDAYDIANMVCSAIRDELNEYFECTGEDGEFDPIPILSFVEMLTGEKPTQRGDF